jgi:hypothetical protein
MQRSNSDRENKDFHDQNGRKDPEWSDRPSPRMKHTLPFPGTPVNGPTDDAYFSIFMTYVEF